MRSHQKSFNVIRINLEDGVGKAKFYLHPLWLGKKDLHGNEYVHIDMGPHRNPHSQRCVDVEQQVSVEGAGDGSWQKKRAFGKRTRLSVEDVSSWGSFSREFYSPVSKRKGVMRAFFAPSPHAELAFQMVYFAALQGNVK